MAPSLLYLLRHAATSANLARPPRLQGRRQLLTEHGLVGLLGLLPAAGAAGSPAMKVMVSHDYMLTPLHHSWNGFHRERTALNTSRLVTC